MIHHLFSRHGQFRVQNADMLYSTVFRIQNVTTTKSQYYCVIAILKRAFITKKAQVVGKSGPTFQTLPLGLYTHSHHATVTRAGYTKEAWLVSLNTPGSGREWTFAKRGVACQESYCWKHFSCSRSRSQGERRGWRMPMTSSKQAKVLPRNTGHRGQHEDRSSVFRREGGSVNWMCYFLSTRRPVSSNLSSRAPFHQWGLAGSSLDISGSELIKY